MKGLIYKMLRLSNDLNAIQRGRVPQRIVRRVAGKAAVKAVTPNKRRKLK